MDKRVSERRHLSARRSKLCLEYTHVGDNVPKLLESEASHVKTQGLLKVVAGEGFRCNWKSS